MKFTGWIELCSLTGKGARMDHATCAALLLATHFATSLLPLTIRLWSSGDTISNSEKLSMVSLELVFSLPGRDPRSYEPPSLGPGSSARCCYLDKRAECIVGRRARLELQYVGGPNGTS